MYWDQRIDLNYKTLIIHHKLINRQTNSDRKYNTKYCRAALWSPQLVSTTEGVTTTHFRAHNQIQWDHGRNASQFTSHRANIHDVAFLPFHLNYRMFVMNTPTFFLYRRHHPDPHIDRKLLSRRVQWTHNLALNALGSAFLAADKSAKSYSGRTFFGGRRWIKLLMYTLYAQILYKTIGVYINFTTRIELGLWGVLTPPRFWDETQIGRNLFT